MSPLREDHDAEQSAALSTPVGTITIAGNGRSIVSVGWRDPAGPVDAASPDPLLREAVRQLRAYFDGKLLVFDIPVDLGTMSESARAVLTTLHEDVPAGETVTYGELARMSGTEVPARGVGTIMGINPLPLVVPCHRVVAGDGLGGYSGGTHGQGLATKRWLLEFEGSLPPTLF
ncbi:methylated-DNA--[protein]-cysteine S-methyltransferase [Gordonia sp. zg691]|uniref:Methylated-DNA--protein-cysteine methyltransferase n=1 Tax=Gordonia jinghuaiqii TaxID=2758710 RepID=A0A7D7R0W7_9ACTN|nr:methylated-DNA--[protein]-cysteine S-methyltransferase [Gordonia jinghuaiqii]MBD0862721.1 methylated-DNA--[protein]-cysteine S-methyltransferase [Gordonia jinghuaiqii]MCR5976804.1 methylated-DNA--[protein]-cysteine S-methyltransferase [Gordonia jinghuaiqii]QMS99971.1 methylated-DNA--[protein]-cysteine S-methyltransferase [Gordonia jinghuaiqii]